MDGVAGLMRKQFGVISREQAHARGVMDAGIRVRVDRAEWERTGHGTYRSTTAPRTWWQAATTALLAAGPDSALSHASAGFVLNLESLNDRPPTIIEVSVPRNRRVRLDGISAHHVRDRVPAFTSRGLRVTTLARTFVDLAGVLDEERLEFALDSAYVRCNRLGDWLDTYLATLEPRGHPGIATLSKLIRLRRDGSSESPLEVKTWRALRRAGLDDSRRQYVIKDTVGHHVLRADFAWPAHRIALHTDSTIWHSQQERMTRDAEQRNALQSLGWFSMVVTHSLLKTNDWLELLKAQLTQRRPHLPLPFH
ncbi:MAG: hypothetical protein ACO1OB_13850 [Archangium sp.]